MNFKISDNKIWLENENGTEIAVVDFPPKDKNIVDINHTFVDSSLRGQGVAGKLMQEVVRVLRESNRKAEISCSYAVGWFEKHLECADVLE